jgi:hypothetical protein
MVAGGRDGRPGRPPPGRRRPGGRGWARRPDARPGAHRTAAATRPAVGRHQGGGGDRGLAAAPRTHLYRAAAPDRWSAMAAVQNAGLALDRVRRTLQASWSGPRADPPPTTRRSTATFGWSTRFRPQHPWDQPPPLPPRPSRRPGSASPGASPPGHRPPLPFQAPVACRVTPPPRFGTPWRGPPHSGWRPCWKGGAVVHRRGRQVPERARVEHRGRGLRHGSRGRRQAVRRPGRGASAHRPGSGARRDPARGESFEKVWGKPDLRTLRERLIAAVPSGC